MGCSQHVSWLDLSGATCPHRAAEDSAADVALGENAARIVPAWSLQQDPQMHQVHPLAAAALHPTCARAPRSGILPAAVEHGNRSILDCSSLMDHVGLPAMAGFCSALLRWLTGIVSWTRHGSPSLLDLSIQSYDGLMLTLQIAGNHTIRMGARQAWAS